MPCHPHSVFTPLKLQSLFRLCWVFMGAPAFLWLRQAVAPLRCSAGLLAAVASPVAEHKLQGRWTQWLWPLGSRAQAQYLRPMGLAAPQQCGIFPGQGSNQCPLHCRVDSQSLNHQEVLRPQSYFREYYGLKCVLPQILKLKS